MKTLRMVLLAIILAAVARAPAQDNATAAGSSKPWHEGFEPVQKLVNAACYGSDLKYFFQVLGSHSIAFKIDALVMRREWEPIQNADGTTSWVTRTRLVCNLINRPLWEFMDYAAQSLDGIWVIESGVCVLKPKPEEVEHVAPRPPQVVLWAVSGAIEGGCS